MRFERSTRAENIFSELLGRPGKMRAYVAKVGAYQFVIAYDEVHLRWTASYKVNSQQKTASPLGEDVLPGWEGMPTFATQTEAENACRAAWKLLRAKTGQKQ